MLARAVELGQKGHSASKISDYLNDQFGTKLTRNAVIGKFHRDGIVFFTTPASQQKRIAKRPPRRHARKQSAPQPKPPKMKAEPFTKHTDDFIPPPARGLGVLAVASLQTHDCRYPIGEPEDMDFRFCHERQRQGSSYCEHHHRVCNKEA